MTKTAWPFTATATAPGKRATSVDEWSQILRYAVASGVLDGELNGLEVSASGADMQTDVATGRAIVQGFGFQSTAVEALTHSAADGANDRIDRVILRLDFAAESVDLAVLEGTPAGSPTAPALTQTWGTTWEISLAQVLINAGDTSIDPGDVTDERELLTLPTAAAGTPVAAMMPYAGTSAPDGWLLCDGSAVSRSTYADLFAAVGTTFGVGDGSTTFNVPDLRGRTPLGLDNLGGTPANRVTNAQADSLGGSAGAETHTLTTGEMPSHTHNVQGRSAATGSTHVTIHGSDTTATATNAATATGSGGAHNNMPPYLAVGYIIKT